MVCIAKLFQKITLLITLYALRWWTEQSGVVLTVILLHTHQHRNLQIKAHRFDFISISPLGALQHFLDDNHPRTIPPCSLQEDHSSRLAATLWSLPSGSAPFPAHQHVHRLSTEQDLHVPLQHWVPGVLEEHGKCESAWAGTHWWVQPALGTAIPRYDGTACLGYTPKAQ